MDRISSKLIKTQEKLPKSWNFVHMFSTPERITRERLTHSGWEKPKTNNGGLWPKALI